MKIYRTILTSLALIFFSSSLIFAADEPDFVDDEGIPFFLPDNPVQETIHQFLEDNNLELAPPSLEEYGEIEADDTTYLGLSLDGGGVRGYLTALFLERLSSQLQIMHRERLEELSNNYPAIREVIEFHDGQIPLYKIFDYIGGTSIGGILSLGIASDIPIGNLVGLFENRGEEVFRARFQLGNLWGVMGAQYKAAPLEALLQEYFPNHQTMADLRTQLLITSCTNGGEPWVFRNEEHGDYRVWEVARCTSAAPTYFPGYAPTHIDDHALLFDGGLWANNPSALVLANIVSDNQAFSRNRIHLLSLGTGRGSLQTLARNAGILSFGKIIDIALTTHNYGYDLTGTQFLGENYYRVNPLLARAIDLADTSPEAGGTLRQIVDSGEYEAEINRFVNNTREIVRQKLDAWEEEVRGQ